LCLGRGCFYSPLPLTPPPPHTHKKGVLSVVIYLRFFLHLANSTVLKHIYGMLRSALFEILPFFVLFIIVFLGFSLGFYVVFGPYVKEYRSFMRTIVTNTRMIMGGNSELYEELYLVNWIMAPLLYYTLAVTAFVLLFNVFLAIIVHTYAVYKNELERDPEDRLKDGIYTTMAWKRTRPKPQTETRRETQSDRAARSPRAASPPRGTRLGARIPW